MRQNLHVNVKLFLFFLLLFLFSFHFFGFIDISTFQQDPCFNIECQSSSTFVVVFKFYSNLLQSFCSLRVDVVILGNFTSSDHVNWINVFLDHVIQCLIDSIHLHEQIRINNQWFIQIHVFSTFKQRSTFLSPCSSSHVTISLPVIHGWKIGVLQKLQINPFYLI